MSGREGPRILISAGEASGDRLGAGLARALKRLEPGVRLFGMGGDEMAEAGVRLVQHASEVAVVGLTEVVSRLPAIRQAMRRMTDALRRERPDLLVPIDFPDFNLRLSARAGRVPVPVVYYVSPQVWAWRPGRVRAIARLVRRMLVLFPFERAFYERAGVPVEFVGHPAVDGAAGTVDREELARRLDLEPDTRLVALLPGSRPGELQRLLPPMLEAADRLRKERPDLRFVIPRARTLPRGTLSPRVERSGVPGVRVHDGDYPALLRICEAGAVASGTASLEAALAGLPMAVVYRVQPFSYLLGRLLVRVKHVALPNLIAGRRLVPELVQSDCTPERIARELSLFLDRPEHAAATRSALGEVGRRLGPPGAFERAARGVLAEVQAGTG